VTPGVATLTPRTSPISGYAVRAMYSREGQTKFGCREVCLTTTDPSSHITKSEAKPNTPNTTFARRARPYDGPAPRERAAGLTLVTSLTSPSRPCTSTNTVSVVAFLVKSEAGTYAVSGTELRCLRQVRRLRALALGQRDRGPLRYRA